MRIIRGGFMVGRITPSKEPPPATPPEHCSASHLAPSRCPAPPAPREGEVTGGGARRRAEIPGTPIERKRRDLREQRARREEK